YHRRRAYHLLMPGQVIEKVEAGVEEQPLQQGGVNHGLQNVQEGGAVCELIVDLHDPFVPLEQDGILPAVFKGFDLLIVGGDGGEHIGVTVIVFALLVGDGGHDRFDRGIRGEMGDAHGDVRLRPVQGGQQADDFQKSVSFGGGQVGKLLDVVG